MLAGKVVASSATITWVLKIISVLAPKLLFVRPMSWSESIPVSVNSFTCCKTVEMHPVAYTGGQTSEKRIVQHGVPQGLVLGPLLFILIIAGLIKIAIAFGLTMHGYADDVQLYSSCLPADTERLKLRFLDCIMAIIMWTEENRLALNPAKTEFLWMCTPRRKHLLSHSPFTLGDVTVVPSKCLRLLGVLLDETLSFEEHIGNVVRGCYYHLRRIRSVRRHLPISGAVHLVRALVLPRLDYCNSVLLGLPDGKLNRLQSVLNTGSCSGRLQQPLGSPCDPPVLRDQLHWLPAFIHKRCWLTFRALNDPHCPQYLAELVLRSTSNARRSALRSGHRVLLLVPPPSQTPKFGDRSFSRGNPLLWNALPTAVTEANSAGLFLRELKTHLFSLGYG